MRLSPDTAVSGTLAGLAALVLVGCGPQFRPFTPEPQPSVAGDEAREAAEVVDAFLALIAEPEVTYRVEAEVDIGSNGRGGPAVALRGRYDISADRYAGWASGTAAVVESPDTSVFVVGLDDETHVWAPMSDTWSSVDSVSVLHRPTALAEIEVNDMVFMGRTASGLFEFDVRRWLFGDPVATWSRLIGFDDEGMPATSVESHRTRLLVDADGVPREMQASWTFTAQGETAVSLGSSMNRYSAFGVYVSIPVDPQTAPFRETSHNIIVGVDEEKTIVTEPWSDVGPRADDPSTEIEVSVEYTGDEPVMLGIEGAIFFLESHDAAGARVLDALVPIDGGVVIAPAGRQRLSAYYRACDGNCSILGPPTAFCTTGADLEAGLRYRLAVVVTSARPLAADCILTQDT